MKKTEAQPETAYSRAETKRLLEAILFAADKPVAAASLGQILSGTPEAEIRAALAEMSREYEEMGRSFVLKEVGGGYLLFTHPAYEPWIRKLFRGRLTLRLSKSSMETLAIIAYRQPVTKQDVETIRGVNADGVLNTLLDRKLVRVVGRKEGAGRALLYGTTNEFLIYMGLNDLNELPQMEEMKAILETREGPTDGTDGPIDASGGPFIAPGATEPAAADAAPVPLPVGPVGPFVDPSAAVATDATEGPTTQPATEEPTPEQAETPSESPPPEQTPDEEEEDADEDDEDEDDEDEDSEDEE